MKRWIIVSALAAIVVGMSMSGVVFAQSLCCEDFETCESVTNGNELMDCVEYAEIDVDDDSWDSASGWVQVNSGTNQRKEYHYGEGTPTSDSTDKDCDDNTTESICLDGFFIDSIELAGTVTWYGPGSQTCP